MRYNNTRQTKYLIPVAVLVFLAIILAMSIYTVPAGMVGVITRWGAVNRVVYPGLGIKIPVVEGIVKLSIQTQKDQVDASAASKDLQTVTSTIAVNYHLDGKYATDVYQNIGIDYQSIVIAPAIQNIFKATTAGYTAEELITNREGVRIQAEQALTDQLAQYHVVVENFNIVSFDFSSEFNAAIEAKQVAQQEVETAKQKLAQAEVDAQTAVTQAQGQADAQAALNQTGALTDAYLRYLFLTKWNGELPAVMGGVDTLLDVSGYLDGVSSSTSK
jgi:regulator of protease activity HflC (stomatin/prohibitin superfamily)